MQVQSQETEDCRNQPSALARPLTQYRSQLQGLRRSLVVFMQSLETGKYNHMESMGICNHRPSLTYEGATTW